MTILDNANKGINMITTYRTAKDGTKVAYKYAYKQISVLGIETELKQIKDYCKKNNLSLSEVLAPVIKKAAKALK